MHIQKHNAVGDALAESLCGIDHGFDRSINAPFRMGQDLCEKCLKALDDVH